MRVRLTRLRFAFILATFFTFSGAEATSVVRSLTRSPTACHLTAKFIEAKIVDGKMRWFFTRLGEAASPKCAGLPANFRVLIPSGSYSTISRSNVYPLAITEPSPGAEIELKLENYGNYGWLIAKDSDSLKVIR